MSTARPRGSLALSMIVLAGCVTGCGGADDHTSAPSTSRSQAAFKDQDVIRIEPLEPQDDLQVIDRLYRSQIATTIARRDHLVIQCLAERGLDVGLVRTTDSGARSMGLTHQEFAETWGFGIVTKFTDAGTIDPAFRPLPARVLPRVRAGAVPETALDLTQVSRATESRALAELHGTVRSVGPDGTSVEVTATGPPCETEANRAVGIGDGSGPVDAGTRLRDLASNDVKNDPEILSTRAAYRACMDAQGFPGLDAPVAAYHSIEAEFSKLSSEALSLPGATGAVPDPARLGVDLRNRFAALRTREHSTAIANVSCEAEFDAHARPRNERLQQQVIDANQALVSEIG